MPEPEKMDVDAWGDSASEVFGQHRRSDASSSWVECSEDLVLEAMLSTGYPAERIRLVKGLVEERLPHPDLGKIALLRLDTDWYTSTLHELKCLCPLVVDGGVVIVDDYGHFAGARQAVDEYFSSIGERPYLHRIDYTGRLLIKRSRR